MMKRLSEELVIKLIERATPMKGIRDRGEYLFGYCPSCGRTLFLQFNYCSNCGQRIDWTTEEEDESC